MEADTGIATCSRAPAHFTKQTCCSSDTVPEACCFSTIQPAKQLPRPRLTAPDTSSTRRTRSGGSRKASSLAGCRPRCRVLSEPFPSPITRLKNVPVVKSCTPQQIHHHVPGSVTELRSPACRQPFWQQVVTQLLSCSSASAGIIGTPNRDCIQTCSAEVARRWCSSHLGVASTSGLAKGRFICRRSTWNSCSHKLMQLIPLRQ